ncbi:Twin-arginine leader-binding protein DmsD [Raoultella terrigena]|uniref:Twin-arginine leader-binding protein DmsD n=1 Tax=Raoultella terrigena TaxID=577 RepID=A0A485BLQ9_RAOTE|nr:Twin-arginine leader-binding protein DmsD [Raoultella terrigena]
MSCSAIRRWSSGSGCGRTASPAAAQNNDPEDSFGTLLLLAAWLCESGQDEAFSQLLARHLLPWSGRFLAVFVSEAGHPFYQALGQLSQATLAEWQDTLTLVVADKPLYR